MENLEGSPWQEMLSKKDNTTPDNQTREVKEEDLGTGIGGTEKIQMLNTKKDNFLYILAGISIILIVLTSYLFTKPKDFMIYKKHEEFGPCISKKEQCFQDTIIRQSGKIQLIGQKNKDFSVKQENIEQIEDLIRQSNILKTECKDTQIVMEYKITHSFYIDGLKKEITSPGCEDELELLENNIAKYLQ